MKFYKNRESGNIVPQWKVKKKETSNYDVLSDEEAKPYNIDYMEQHLSRISNNVSNITTIIAICFFLGLVGALITIASNL